MMNSWTASLVYLEVVMTDESVGINGVPVAPCRAGASRNGQDRKHFRPSSAGINPTSNRGPDPDRLPFPHDPDPVPGCHVPTLGRASRDACSGRAVVGNRPGRRPLQLPRGSLPIGCWTAYKSGSAPPAKPSSWAHEGLPRNFSEYKDQ